MQTIYRLPIQQITSNYTEYKNNQGNSFSIFQSITTEIFSSPSPSFFSPHFFIYLVNFVRRHQQSSTYKYMFGWCNTCATEPIGAGYLVQKQSQSPKFYSKFTDIKETDLNDSNTSIVRVNKSGYDSLSNTLNGKDRKFVDNDFPPGDISLGIFESITTDKWKRISDIVEKPVLFNKDIIPNDALQSHNQSKGFQSAVAALAERPQKLKSLFAGQSFNAKGIYTILLRFKGRIEEVVIDDYVPVNQQGQPLFTKPNQNAVWVMLLEKARAKLYGSYQKMIKNTSTPKVVLQQITFAPSEIVKSSAKEQLWQKILAQVKRAAPLTALTNSSDTIAWDNIHLTKNHYYSVVDAAQLPHKLGSTFKVLKLRNPNASEDYKGQGSASDNLFWEQIEDNQDKTRILSKGTSLQGLIYILFSDYLKYFDELTISHAENTSNYLSESLNFTSKNGLLFQLKILKQNQYSIIIQQNDMRPVQNGAQYQQDGFSRATILLIKDNSNKTSPTDYEHIDGVLKYNEQQTTLQASLAPGKYLVFVKLDPTIKIKNFPSSSSLSVYSNDSVILKQSAQQNYPDLLKKVFARTARLNKRQQYNNDQMWSAWRLIIQGGYAYIAFGNVSQSKHKFIIKFNEEVFNNGNYILKKPFKGKGQQTIQILPGKEEIILLRIKNSEVKEINFPPPIDLQIVAME